MAKHLFRFILFGAAGLMAAVSLAHAERKLSPGDTGNANSTRPAGSGATQDASTQERRDNARKALEALRGKKDDKKDNKGGRQDGRR